MLHTTNLAARNILMAAFLTLGLTLAACGAQEEPPADAPSGDAPAEAPAEQAAALDGDAAHGAEIFTVCAGCHGPDAKGITGLGKDLHANEFIAGMSDDEAVDFLKVGRTASHELNTTGVDMPPKGGNPAYTDQDLYDLVAHIRTLD